MWATLALLASTTLSATQAPELALTNARPTYGMLGPVRTDSKVLPGDAFYLRFNIEGITIDAKGKALYSTALKVTNSDGRVIFQQDPIDLEAVNALGGNSMPGFASVDIGLSQDPGEYQLEVSVTDRANSKTKTLAHKFEVLKPGFGIVRLTTSSDAEGRHQTSVFESGGTAWISGALVGFGRDAQSKQPKLSVGVKVTDKATNKVVFETERGKAEKDIPEDVNAISGNFVLSLNRPGEFVVEISATDHTSREMSMVKFPLRVLAAQ